ncbi:MAG TPA: response regulator [Spirochaetota bacterium]|nr:response regulator [Spirochaetota bacterium]
MQNRILLLDDEPAIVNILDLILKNHNYKTSCFTSPLKALESFKTNNFDVVLSDYFMPEINGYDFFKQIRYINPDIPFIFLTANTDLSKIVEFLKEGVDDYILKPAINDELVFRINRTVELKKHRKIAERIESEKKIIELEHKRIANWRMLYAYKEVKNNCDILNFLNRNINSTGGSMWINLLDEEKIELDENYYKISKDILNLIIDCGKKSLNIFNLISYISQIDEMEYDVKEFSFENLYNYIKNYSENEIGSIIKKYQRKLNFEKINVFYKMSLKIDVEILKKVINELLYNSIKYSPSDTNIEFAFLKNESVRKLEIIIKNIPREMEQDDLEGNKIVGIPYEYSELVFDLFYTIEPFQNRLEEEEWQDGSGLYISRKLLSKMGCLISASNGVDWTKSHPEEYVNFIISIPYE